MRNKGILICALIAIGFLGCKEESLPSVSEVPFISVESITPVTVKEFSDSIEILLTYEDGDGDIGYKDADMYALTVKDSRLPLADPYYVPPLAPPGEEIHIKGILKVKLKNTFLLGAGGNEVTFFELQLTDRAGNKSNKVTTETITITK
jgi:hypothetical protein